MEGDAANRAPALMRNFSLASVVSEQARARSMILCLVRPITRVWANVLWQSWGSSDQRAIHCRRPHLCRRCDYVGSFQSHPAKSATNSQKNLSREV